MIPQEQAKVLVNRIAEEVCEKHDVIVCTICVIEAVAAALEAKDKEIAVRDNQITQLLATNDKHVIDIERLKRDLVKYADVDEYNKLVAENDALRARVAELESVKFNTIVAQWLAAARVEGLHRAIVIIKSGDYDHDSIGAGLCQRLDAEIAALERGKE